MRSNFLVVRTLEIDGSMMLYCSGQAQDLVDVSGAEPRFASRRLVFDSRAVETLMVIPI